MLIMLSLGGSSEKISKMVSKSVDNADFVSFKNVDDMITQSNLRRYAFSRLIFSAKFIDNDEDMSKLCDYVRDNMGRVEIVYILSPDQNQYEVMFKEYFDSPLYTIMYVKTPTSKVMTESVSLSIVDLKARYYLLDKPQMGNTKAPTKSVGKVQKSTSNEQESVDTQEQGISALDENGTFGFGNAGGNYQDDSELMNNFQNGSQRNNQNSAGFDNGSYSHQDTNDENDNSFGFLSEMDLSIGDFGSQHSDSGFIGDDEMEELEKLTQQTPREEEPVEEVREEAAEEDEDVSPQVSVQERPVENLNTGYTVAGVIMPGKVNIILGAKGSGTAPYIINTAMSAQRAGKRVLVVDMDFMNNKVLSYIDTKDFYAQGCSMGITNKRIYNQGGIDFLSNGFNTGVIRGIENVLSGSIMKHYDVVLVDCPCESLVSIPDNILGLCNVVICSDVELSKIREISVALYNRNCVSLFKEAYISKCGRIANKGISREDVNTLKSEMLFPNGCWLDNIQ